MPEVQGALELLPVTALGFRVTVVSIVVDFSGLLNPFGI